MPPFEVPCGKLYWNVGNDRSSLVPRVAELPLDLQYRAPDEIVEAPLYEARSYFEDKRCIFYLESCRSRAELSGTFP